MNDQDAETAADAIELITINQDGIRACLEEIALHLMGKGERHLYDNITGALQTLDQNAENIAAAIKSLRREGS